MKDNINFEFEETQISPMTDQQIYDRDWNYSMEAAKRNLAHSERALHRAKCDESFDEYAWKIIKWIPIISFLVYLLIKM